MRILGIESSCDDTAAAVLHNGEVLASVVASQDDIHRQFGGVVPELASRSHLRNITPVIQRALERAQTSLDEIDGIAATCGPGLIGSLLVGLSTAKAIAYARRLPFVGVNHLEGHLLSPRLAADVPFPYLALLVSGGDTSLYFAEAFGHYRFLGSTREDASSTNWRRRAIPKPSAFPGHDSNRAAARKSSSSLVSAASRPRCGNTFATIQSAAKR